MFESAYERNVKMTTVLLKLLASENMVQSLVLGHMAFNYGMCIFFPECHLPKVC
jgi:hypothetical protein